MTKESLKDTRHYRHNPRLPRPKDVLPLNPKILMLDAVETLELGRAVGYWTPDETFSYLNESFKPLISTSVGPEPINQLAAYILQHGRLDSRLPYMTGSDNFKWKHVILAGETVQVTAETHYKSPSNKEYVAKGTLAIAGKLACEGTVYGVFLDRGEEWVPRQEPERIRRERYLKSGRVVEGLYAGIVSVDQIPKIIAPEGAPEAAITILEDDNISLDGTVIRLNPDSRFVLNALLLNLGQKVSRKEVEEMGYRPDMRAGSRQSSFSVSKNWLQRKLVTGHPPRALLIEEMLRNENKKLYGLNPNVAYSFSDQRD